MQRTWAVVDRELRRFRRSPMLIVVSLIFPIVQLVVLGYAFGGNVKHLQIGIVDQDRGLPAVRIRELAGAVSSGARTFETVDYSDQGRALDDLRNGRINGVLTIPPDFSRRVHAFPSGAVYPPQGFPGWMQAIAVVDPFTYAVHAFKSLLLKNTGFEAITADLIYLAIFSVISMTAATMLFKRTL